MPFNAAVDCVRELHGRRLCGTFGSARHCRLRTMLPTNPGEWQNVGTWWTITRMQDSDPDARQIWRAWREGLQLSPDVSCAHTDEFFAGKEDALVKLFADRPWNDPQFEFH